ncbi:AMP-dependent synthetase/ligase [Penicillium verhagenii]|uniref:AMP-dependent synthetase/ligase n=1 Tax=Penicillium verhagenii TaxID=1562060 RepID=UPI0025452E90|nr:AMP-dependent synthetase/ligase [Penicillium verhagenii]KAJ5930877.1 AMP-dependent synthetase/ligase [Penicillium verhagenii]
MATALIGTKDRRLHQSTMVKSRMTELSHSSRDVINLELSMSAKELLAGIRSQLDESMGREAAHSLKITTVLNICWIIAVRCFSPTQFIYLDLHSEYGFCHISDSCQPRQSTPLLEMNADKTVADLLRDYRLIEANINPNRLAGVSFTPDSQGFLKSAVCHVDSASMAKRELAFSTSNCIDTKLILRISHEDDKLQAHLAFLSSDISKALANTILQTFNITLEAHYTRDVSEYNEVLLHDMALEHAITHPNDLAICSWDGNLTYAELDNLTSRLAWHLADMGVGPETVVISCFEKSTWAIVSRLAILKSGGAYVSIDATDPPIFLKDVINRVDAKIILTSPAYQSRYSSMVSNVISITLEMLHRLRFLPGIVCPLVTPRNACLILFTSGSTGQPKGIIQEHRSYATAIKDYNRVLQLGRHSRVFQFDDYAFDISNNDYLTTLVAGGCCCVPTPDKAVSALIDNLNALKANTTFLTPTVAAKFSPQDVPSLNLVCIGGESVSDDLLMRWKPHVKLVNQYGMGEAATFCAYNDHLEVGKSAIVGRSGSGAIWIASPASPEVPVPVGAVGEILIEGPHLARGYLDQVCQKPGLGFLKSTPAWIAQLHPSRARTSRIYRSGDLGRYLHDGTVEHMGRKDTILKLDGNRIECTGVEYVLRRLLGTGDATIVDILGLVEEHKNPVLVAFVYRSGLTTNLSATDSDNLISFHPIMDSHPVSELVQKMKAELSAKMPIHMVPTLFILVNKVPRTRSNKTDRRKLHHIAQKWYSLNCMKLGLWQ